MGVFDVFCAESGIALNGDTRLVMLAESGNGRFEPIALPIKGCYNRYGSIDADDDSLDENGRAVFEFCKKLKYDTPPFGKEFEEHLSVLNMGPSEDSWAEWNGHRVSFALLHGGIYDAIVQTVMSGGKPNWTPYSKASLKNKLLQSLFDEAFRNAAISRAIYPKFPAKLQAELIELLRFRAWGTTLTPLDITKCDQFTGFSRRQNVEGAPEDYLNAARKKYEPFPLLLDALKQDEQRWRETWAD